MEDERGFTTGGRNHPSPQFEEASASRRPAKAKNSSSRQHSISLLPVPRESISPEDLELDKTLVARESFLATESSQGSISSRTPMNSLYSSEVLSNGNATSYSMAVNRGRLDTSHHQQGRERRESRLHSVMKRLRTGSVASSVSSMEAVEVDTRSLTSAKALKRELLKMVEKDTGAMLFDIMGKKYSKERKRAKLLAALLTYSEVNVNERAPSGMTALHYAIQNHDLESARILVSFGANINAWDQEGKTALDLLHSNADAVDSTVSLSRASITPSPSPSPSPSPAPSPEHNPPKQRHKVVAHQVPARQKCAEFLKSIGALTYEFATRLTASVEPFPQVPSSSPALAHRKCYAEVLDWEAQITSHYSNLERNIRSRLQNTTKAGQDAVLSADTAISLAVQLQEMTSFQKAGSRVLCLDGGGMKGLIQLEILSQLEIRTGRKVTELFDWIVGTSTGGIIALGLVYAKKSLVQLRQLYFRMREEVFGKSKGAMSFNTAGLERILKKEFTETRCMDDETYPRVLIAAVKKDHINLKLTFFNNCFNDEHHKHWHVWKVARYTCAAPVLFGEFEEYVDGGLLANNPSDAALTKIQSFYRGRNEKIPLSLVVSVGCGKYPIQALGKVDFMFVGSQGWSSLAGTSNLMALLSYALVETSVADANCRSRCEEQGVRYFRLNPRLQEVITSGETDQETLIAAILQTRKEMETRDEFSNLVLCLHELSTASRKMHSQLNGDESSTSDSSTSSVI